MNWVSLKIYKGDMVIYFNKLLDENSNRIYPISTVSMLKSASWYPNKLRFELYQKYV